MDSSYSEYVVAAEMIAVLAEAYLLSRLRHPHPMRVSLAANLTSWGLGTPVYTYLANVYL